MLEITTEYAIKWFENRRDGIPMPGAKAMYDVAISALRAKMEAEKNGPNEMEADRDAWKRRAKAAERDLGRSHACDTCKHGTEDEWDPCEVCVASNKCGTGWRMSYYEWRGPCAENGGTEDVL